MLYAPGARRPRTLHYHLGPSTRHTVYEAEIVGTILALQLLLAERRPIKRASIALDNTATIQASTLRTAAPGRYLTDMFHDSVQKLREAHPGIRLTLRWVPGHAGVEGNERADTAAKEAAGGRSGAPRALPKGLRKTLPLSASRARQNFKHVLQEKAKQEWQESRRGRRMAEVDRRLPSKTYTRLVSSLPRRHANLLFQLRTGHVPLYRHLERIGKVLTATCPACEEAQESVSHYLLDCPAYSLHRAVHLAPLGRAGRTLSVLLASQKAMRPLFNYINATGRFRGFIGELAELKDDIDDD